MQPVSATPGGAFRFLALVVVLASVAVACGDDTEPATTEQAHPDVIGVEVSRADDGTLRFDVTVSSPYDSPARYADAWRVVGPDATVYAVRELLHDHGGEQPFTRSLDRVEIPDEVDRVIVGARDLINGWGGATVEVELPYHRTAAGTPAATVGNFGVIGSTGS